MKKILIDGENLRHQLAKSLVSQGLIASSAKNDFFKFDLRSFISEITKTATTELEIIYYTTRIQQPSFKIPVKLQSTLDAISGANRRWLSQISNQQIKVIKAGYLKVRQSGSCVHCGKKTLVLQEKGVDVRVSIDLLKLAQDGHDVYIISSDSDITPSLAACRNHKQRVFYVCLNDNVNRSIVSQSDKVITFDSKDVAKYFKGKP